MTVPSSLSKHVYSGNGVNRTWPYTFSLPLSGGVADASVLHVYRSDNGGTPYLVSSSAYTVDVDAKTVTYPLAALDPLASTVKLVLIREVDFVQDAELEDNGAFYAKTHEAAWDNLEYQIQELHEQTERSVKVAVDDSLSPDTLLDEIVDTHERYAEIVADTSTAVAAAKEADEARNETVAASLSVLSLSALAAWDPAKTYSFPAYALDTDGIAYCCVGSNVCSTTHPKDDTANWVAYPVANENIIAGYTDESDATKPLSLAWWIARLGSKQATLRIPTALYAYNVGADVTVPANICLKFDKGGILAPASGKTLTINGPISAGLWQIFGGYGTVTGTPKITETYPEWFGAVGDNSHNDTAAILAAMTFYPCVFLTANKTYKCSDTITVIAGQSLYSSGKRAILDFSTCTAAICLYQNGYTSFVANLKLYTSNLVTDQVGFKCRYSNENSITKNLYVEGFYNGTQFSELWYYHPSDIRVINIGTEGYCLVLGNETEQEDLNGIQFDNIYMQGGKSCVYAKNCVMQSTAFKGCTLEAADLEAVNIASDVDGPLVFTHSYFERNYQNASRTDTSVVGFNNNSDNTVYVDNSIFRELTHTGYIANKNIHYGINNRVMNKSLLLPDSGVFIEKTAAEVFIKNKRGTVMNKKDDLTTYKGCYDAMLFAKTISAATVLANAYYTGSSVICFNLELLFEVNGTLYDNGYAKYRIYVDRRANSPTSKVTLVESDGYQYSTVITNTTVAVGTVAYNSTEDAMQIPITITPPSGVTLLVTGKLSGFKTINNLTAFKTYFRDAS